MDTEIAKGNINELKGQIKQTWGKLTDDDLSRLEGVGDELVGKVQKVYGYSKERAIEEFDKFKKNNPKFYSNKMKINDEIDQTAQQYLTKTRELGSKAASTSSQFMKENPGYTILGAVTVGFLAGAFLTRGKSSRNEH